MEIGKTELERAFQLAKSGRQSDVASLRRQLKAEGYSGNQIEGKSLKMQLARLIKTNAGPDHVIGTCRDFDFVRYYLPPSARDTVRIVRVPCDSPHPPVTPVVVVAPTVSATRLADLKRAYPEVVAKFKGIQVLSQAHLTDHAPAAP